MSAEKEKTAAIILAAGMSRRMGTENKLLKMWHSKPLVSHVCTSALASNCAAVILVTGFQHDQILEALNVDGLDIVHNNNYANGMATSIAAGVKYAVSKNHSKLIILLGDMPQVTNLMIDKLIATSQEHYAKIIAASCNGKRGNPVLWPSAYFDELQSLKGDAGAKDIIANAGDKLITVELGIAAGFDLDTPIAFAAQT